MITIDNYPWSCFEWKMCSIFPSQHMMHSHKCFHGGKTREIASKEKYLIFHLKRCIAACRGGGVKVFFNHRNHFHLFISQLITLRTAVVESIFFAHFKLHSTNQLDANRVLWIFIPLNSSDGMKPCNSIVNWI